MPERINVSIIPIQTGAEELSSIAQKYFETNQQTPPWNTLPIDADKFFGDVEKFTQQPGFGALYAQHEGEIVGASLYRKLTLTQIRKSDDLLVKSKLINFLREQEQLTGIHTFVSIDGTFVLPDYQGQGIAQQLERATLQQILINNPGGAIVFGELYSDNSGMQHVLEKLNFSPSGAKDYTSRGAKESAPYYEYWYTIVTPETIQNPQNNNE